MNDTEKSFEDTLGDAFEIARSAVHVYDDVEGFKRVGRFQLLKFTPGTAAGIAEIKYFPVDSDDPHDGLEWATTSWGLDELRILIHQMPDNEERTYLKSVEAALYAYSWMQWAVKDTGSSMLPDPELGEIANNAKRMMEALGPIRNPDAVSSVPKRPARAWLLGG